LNPDYVIQTLGAIVQAYASMLAIGGAFYIFVIERTRTEYKEAKNDFEKNVNNLIDVLDGNHFFDNENREAVIRRIKNGEVAWTEKFIKNFDFPEDWINEIIEYDFTPYKASLEEYQGLEKKTGMWFFRSFYSLIYLCAGILGSTIFVLWVFSTYSISDLSLFGYFIIVMVSILGIGVFLWYCVQLGKIYSKNSNPLRN